MLGYWRKLNWATRIWLVSALLNASLLVSALWREDFAAALFIFLISAFALGTPLFLQWRLDVYMRKKWKRDRADGRWAGYGANCGEQMTREDGASPPTIDTGSKKV